MKRILISTFCGLLLTATSMDAKTSVKEMKVNNLAAPLSANC